jgi:hypothetical protein
MLTPEVQPLVVALQRALGLTLQKGQITLHLVEGQVRAVEYRVWIDGRNGNDGTTSASVGRGDRRDGVTARLRA